MQCSTYILLQRTSKLENEVSLGRSQAEDFLLSCERSQHGMVKQHIKKFHTFLEQDCGGLCFTGEDIEGLQLVKKITRVEEIA